MSTPENHTNQAQEQLDQRERIAKIENETAFFNAVSARFSYQTAMLEITETAEANKWIDELEAKNQQKEDQREEENQRRTEINTQYQNGEITLKESLAQRFEIPQTEKENINISNEQPAENIELETEKAGQTEQPTEDKK